MTSPSDEGRAGAGPVGFEEWYRPAHRQVLAALVAYCGDLAAAAEATDEAFARAFARWSEVWSMQSPAGWTFVVARNVLRRAAARAARDRSLAPPLAAGDGDPSGQVLAALEVAEALRPLTARQREVVVLHHGLDLAQEQVADLLGISRSTVATTLLDARRALGVAAAGHRGAGDFGGDCGAEDAGERAVENEKGESRA